MNIFVVDNNPVIAAKALCDKHIVKMPLETAQMLCSVHWLHNSKAPYRLTHKNHPCTKWATYSNANYEWLVRHGIALCEEYTARYNRRHKCQDVVEWAKNNKPKTLKHGQLTEQPQCMPDDCKSDFVVEAYRNYYRKHKHHIASWKRNKPMWFEQTNLV
jgi:hypothetical protein